MQAFVHVALGVQGRQKLVARTQAGGVSQRFLVAIHSCRDDAQVDIQRLLAVSSYAVIGRGTGLMRSSDLGILDELFKEIVVAW